MPPSSATGITIPRWALGLILTILGWAGSAFVGYAAADKSATVRISVIEEQYRQLHEEMGELRADVKTLLRRHE